MLSISDTTPVLDLVFDSLGNATRRAILHSLSFRPATVSQLAIEHHVSLPSIHRHIRSLEAAGLIQRKKIGRTNFVAISRRSLGVAQTWIGQFRPEWGSDHETLENRLSSLTQRT